ncbi:MAG: hypothetical protein HC837_19465, partial [Chloroflexaceae bacterium]|nr:hypothetical protein [Chloroflexaceae bacterium]
TPDPAKALTPGPSPTRGEGSLPFLTPGYSPTSDPGSRYAQRQIQLLSQQMQQSRILYCQRGAKLSRWLGLTR